MLMRALPLFFITLVMFQEQGHACDFPIPNIQTSEFVSDKTIFWGLAVSEKWDGETKTDFQANTYFEVDIIKSINGNARNRVKVWGDKTSCTTPIPLGEVFLFVTIPHEKGGFYTEQTISDIASNQAIINNFSEGINTKVGGPFYPPNLEDLVWNKSSKWERDCSENLQSKVTENDYCLPKELIEEMSLTYKNEYEEVKAMPIKSSWWQKLIR